MINKRAGYGAEADWWSAGVMLFEMSHGYTPFTDSGTVDSENKVLANIASADYKVEYEAGSALLTLGAGLTGFFAPSSPA